MQRRRYELDTLRGMAAMTVLIGHYLLVIPVFEQDTFQQGWNMVNLLKYTPLHILWAGHEAVILFFLLSGFVLSLPFLSHQPQSSGYFPYLIKRICRIYIPFLVALCVALVLRYLSYKEGAKNLSDWFLRNWVNDISWDLLWQHLILIPYYNNTAYNPVFWSLVHEMRISLIFPFLVIIVIRYHWAITLFSSLFLSLAAYVLHHSLPDIRHDYLLTMQYLHLFIIGSVLAKHHQKLISWIQQKTNGIKWLWCLLALLLYTSKWTFYSLSPPSFVNDLLIACGTVIMIILILRPGRHSKLFTSRPMVFLGEISYSLYLYHAVVLFFFLHTFYFVFPIWMILFLSSIASILLSACSYQWIELPSIKLGRKLTKIYRQQKWPFTNNKPSKTTSTS